MMIQIDPTGNMWLELIKLSPIIALLGIFIFYLYKENDKKDKEIKELYDHIRNSEKENLQLLSGLSATLDRIMTADQTNTDSILRELSAFKNELKIILSARHS
jgi:preprotein translocase subunit YajC